MSNYISIHQYGRDEIIINKSRFIGTASPVNSEEEALEFIDKVKKEYKDATHNCYAYTVGYNYEIQRFSDDGEPSGTAGIPILNVIKGENIKNVVVVVTRYFGGILLGAGGLVRAYTKGAKIAVESGLIVDKELYYDVSFETEYTLLGKIENELTKNNFIIKNKNYQQNVIFNLLVKETAIEKLNSLISNLTSGKTKLIIAQADYYSVKDYKVIY